MEKVKNVAAAAAVACAGIVLIEAVWFAFAVGDVFGVHAGTAHVAALVAVPVAVFVGALTVPPGRRE